MASLPVASRDYASFMECREGDHWLPAATSQIASWLRGKGFDVDLTIWGEYQAKDRVLAIHPLPEGRVQGLHVQLIEDGHKTGTWTTDILLHDEPGSEDWVNLTVTNSLGGFVAVPRLSTYLMDVLMLGDGKLEFTATPRLLRAQDVDQLTELLADPGRHGLVFVAGTGHDAGMFEPFVAKVTQWSGQVRGLAQVVVLDPYATAELADRVGQDLATPAWTLRTYRPGVDFGSRWEGRRHKILGTARLATDRDGAITTLLGDIARQQASTRLAVPGVLAMQRRIRRLETARLVESVLVPELVRTSPPDKRADDLTGPAPLEPPSTARARGDEPQPSRDEDTALGALVRRVLGIAEVTEEALRSVLANVASRRQADAAAAVGRQLEDMQNRVDELEDANRELTLGLEDAQLECQIALLDLDNHRARAAFLERRLEERGDYDARYLDVPAEFERDLPDSFDQLLSRIEAMATVSFTGDLDEVDKLNQVDTNNAALRNAWEAVLALHDYCRARAQGLCENGLDWYLNNTPSGFVGFPPGKFGNTETAVTMKRFGSERVFRVPEHVEAGGTIVMKPHFKLAKIGMVSPRMYFYDGHPHVPHIYIGYLGQHLTNTKTR